MSLYIPTNLYGRPFTLMRSQLNLLQAIEENKTTTCVSSRRNGYSTAMAIYAIASAIRGDNVVIIEPNKSFSDNTFRLVRGIIDEWVPSMLQRVETARAFNFDIGSRITIIGHDYPYFVRGYNINTLIVNNMEHFTDRNIDEALICAMPAVRSNRNGRAVFHSSGPSKVMQNIMDSDVANKVNVTMKYADDACHLKTIDNIDAKITISTDVKRSFQNIPTQLTNWYNDLS